MCVCVVGELDSLEDAGMGAFPCGFVWGSWGHVEPLLGLNVPYPVLEMAPVGAYKSSRAGCKGLFYSFGADG